MSDALITENNNRPVRLNNGFCPYCFIEFCDQTKDTNEHVIGRRFVPLASLEKSWNLILRCCENCNSEKADLEDDISAVTLLSHIFFDGKAISPEQKNAIAKKLKGSKSRYTGKAVADSRTSLNFSGEVFPGLTMKANLVGLPQIDRSRLLRLVELHIRAFYFWLSYSDELRCGSPPVPYFGPTLETHKNDWGSPVFLHFMETTNHWDTRLNAIAAEGYFKIEFKKHPSKELRSYAIEYNKAYRCVGFFGLQSDIEEAYEAFPKLAMTPAWKDGDDTYYRRREVPLKEKDDLLFTAPHSSNSDPTT